MRVSAALSHSSGSSGAAHRNDDWNCARPSISTTTARTPLKGSQTRSRRRQWEGREIGIGGNPGAEGLLTAEKTRKESSELGGRRESWWKIGAGVQMRVFTRVDDTTRKTVCVELYEKE